MDRTERLMRAYDLTQETALAKVREAQRLIAEVIEFCERYEKYERICKDSKRNE